MATYRKRGNKWSFRIDVAPPGEPRRQITVSKSKEFPGGFKTKKEAQTAATQMQNELDSGIYVKETDMTFEKLVDEWLNHYREEGVKPSTILKREKDTQYLKRFFSGKLAKNITKKMYQEFLRHLKNNYAKTSVIGINSTGKIIFKYAQEFNFIKNNPTDNVRIGRSQVTVQEIESEEDIPKYFEKDELALFLQTVKKHGKPGDYMCFLMLAYSGIRIGELGALKWGDLNEAEGTMKITKTLYCPRNTLDYILLSPKTKTSIREISLDPIIFEELKKHKVLINEVKMAYRKTYHDEDFVFVNLENWPGYPMTNLRARQRMKRILKLANLPKTFSPHSFRHTHTSLLAEAGVKLETIMERLGHANDNITRMIYRHVTKNERTQAAVLFGNVLKNVEI